MSLLLFEDLGNALHSKILIAYGRFNPALLDIPTLVIDILNQALLAGIYFPTRLGQDSNSYVLSSTGEETRITYFFPIVPLISFSDSYRLKSIVSDK